MEPSICLYHHWKEKIAGDRLYDIAGSSDLAGFLSIGLVAEGREHDDADGVLCHDEA